MANLCSCGGQLENRAGYFRAPKERDDPYLEAIKLTCVATLVLTLSSANIKPARYCTLYLLLEAAF